MAFLLAYVHLILAHSKGQGHTNYDCEYLTNDDRQENIVIANSEEIACSLSIGMFTFDLDPFEI